MKRLLVALFVALLLAGCGEDVEVPKMIKCDGCGKAVSSAGEFCTLCSHPVADSVEAYVDTRVRVRQEEEERKRNLDEF